MRLFRTLYNLRELIKAETLLPNQYERTYHSANLPCKKGIRSEMTMDKCCIFLTLAACLQHGAHTMMASRPPRISVLGTVPKGSKILTSQQVFARRLHRV